MDLDQIDQRPDIDFLIIADRAEAINGKLYMMGGAWEHISIADPSQPITFSIAMGILIPWNATNERHRMRLAVQDADGATVAELDGELGRRPPAALGRGQRAAAAVCDDLRRDRAPPGAFAVIAYLNEQECRRTSFNVTVGPPHQ